MSQLASGAAPTDDDRPGQSPQGTGHSAGQPRSASPTLPRTGDAAVDEALATLEGVTTQSLPDQVSTYTGAHRRLQDRLADLDG